MDHQHIFPCGFGELLKTFRKRQCLTQRQLAQQLGVNMNTLSSWELGSYLPATRGRVLELARHLALSEQETRQLLEASLTALAPYWAVPFPRNPFFTGREAILETLYSQLCPEHTAALTQSIGLSGLGGVGKTQIALEYAYRYALDYSAVLWVGAETEEQLLADLGYIASTLQLPECGEKDVSQVAAAVGRWLSMHKAWLLIWDNLEEPAMLARFLPAVRQGSILITTRCQALGTLAQGINLLPLAPDEGILFLLRRGKVLAPDAHKVQIQQFAQSLPEEYAATSRLVEMTGALPLALDQAGAYIDETGCSLAAYLQRYEQQEIVLLSRRGKPTQAHPQSVATTLLLSMERLHRESPPAAALLGVCAFFSASAIPEEVFTRGAKYLGAELEPLEQSPSQFDQVLAQLRRFSLVQRHATMRTLSLHRLVQRVVREQMCQNKQTLWQQRIVSALNELLPEVTVESSTEIWQCYERFLSHVLTVTAALSNPQDEGTLAHLLWKTADYLRVRGNYEQVEALYKRAICLLEQAQGPDHLQLVYPLRGLADLYVQQGQNEQAECLLRRALHLQEQTQGPEHPQVAVLLVNLGILLKNRGQGEEAGRLYERSLAIQTQALGPDHPQLMKSLYNLARLRLIQGSMEQAEYLLQRAVQIGEHTWGAEHPSLAYPLNALVELYLVQEKDAQAEMLSLRVRALWEQAGGSEHPLVAYPLHNLAIVAERRGLFDQAEHLLEQALQIVEQAQGPMHPNVGYPLDTLGFVYRKQGKYEQAESLYRRALQIWVQTLGKTHPSVAMTLTGLAQLFLAQGKEPQAEALYQQAMAMRDEYPGLYLPETAEILHDLACLYQRQGHFQQARLHAERALVIRERVLGETHSGTIATRTILAHLLERDETLAEISEREAIARPHGAAPQTEEALDPPYQGEEISALDFDLLQRFLGACCELSPLAWCRSSDLWQAYTWWCADIHHQVPLSRRAFTVQIQTRGCRRDRTNTARIWRGIQLVEDSFSRK